MRHVKTGVLLAGLLCLAPAASAADIGQLPVETIFVTSSGYWEDEAEEGEARRGYYKLVALRQPDRTATVHLQRIAVGDQGLEVVESVELEEITALKPYVTDIRPENSSGIVTQPGFFATIHLKTDPAARTPESWTVLIDDLGDIKVERASN